MKVQRSPSREALVLEGIKSSFTADPREGIHLSDLLNPRKSYWQRVLPLAPTNAEVLYWLAGRGHEDALGRVAGMVVTPQKFFSVPGATAEDVLSPISYRPDFTFYELFPGEFKTRRSNLAEPGEELQTYDTYLEQHGGYCALEGVNYGLLLVLSLLEGRSHDPLKPTEPVLAVYDVMYTDEELATRLQQLLDRRDQFEAALIGWSMQQLGYGLGSWLANESTPDARFEGAKPLPLCKDWMCGKPIKVVDKKPRCNTCNKDFETQYGIEKHTTSKTGTGHQVENETVHWEYLARCKWHSNCRPWEVDPTRGARA